MANKFLNFVDDRNINATQSYEDFANDSQRKQGFKSGDPASSIRVNTALRQANLVAKALMDVVAPNNQSVDFRSKSSDIALLIQQYVPNKATIATYASEDKSKGTIEERLTKLGFKDSVSLNLGGTYAGELYRQGNLVYGHILPKIWSNLANIVIPTNFRPKVATSIVNCMISGNTYAAFIKTDGSISLENSSGAIASSTWSDICVGWECNPL